MESMIEMVLSVVGGLTIFSFFLLGFGLLLGAWREHRRSPVTWRAGASAPRGDRW